MSGGKGNISSNQILALLFNGTAIPGLAQNATSSPITTLYWALHTADPGASGDQTTHEAAYTGYSRVGKVRTTGGFVVTGNNVSPAASIIFPTNTGGSETETFLSIGLAASGASQILYRAQIAPPLACAIGVAPTITTDTQITES